ncbi:MAG TPA: hypothetical protein ENI20_07670 [Bacteroides sp.]|nr:hypothetical protein [Bacteroides sp.]
MSPKPYIFLFLAIFHLNPFLAMGSDDPVVISRLQGEIVFDGVPDEPAWNESGNYPMVTHSPIFGKEPQERTDVRILFDEEYVYVGASMYTKDVSTIRSTSKKRDDLKPDIDWFGITFDSYNDNENGLAFWTTPTGLRTDMAIFNDAASERLMPINLSWNTHWDVKCTRSQEGWFSEMRIPVSSLKFQEKDGKVIMGLILLRYLPYHNEIYVYPGIPNEYGPWSAFKVSLAQDVVFPGLKSKKPLYITPYVAAGINQLNELNSSETGYEYSRDKSFNAGVDLKFGITSNLTMDLTVNTDFAQVEADDEQVNLTRFDLYFEEKRQFFLERASVFDFRTGGTSTMFYSRRIGLDEDGNIVPIIGGVRLIGRTGGLDLGFMNMQTMATDSLPSENFGVLRMKSRVLNEYSYVGGIYTSRIGLDGSFNQAYGVDALFRLTGDEYLGIVWGQSFETGLSNKPLSMLNGRYRLGWERRKSLGLHYELFISGTGLEYNPGIGFQSREDYHIAGGYLNYLWQPGESSPIQRHGPRSVLRYFINASRGVKESEKYDLNYLVEFKNSWQFSLGAGYRAENVFETFELSDDAFVPPGYYTFSQFLGFVTTPQTRPVWLNIEGMGGGYYDGSIINLQFMPNWSISSSLTITGAYIYSQVDLPERSQQYISHIARLKALVMFTTKLSISAFAQYNSDTQKIGSNVRFRYNPREGNDLWLVYNEDTNTDLKREIPYRPTLAGRTIMLKYTYTFRL